MCVCVGGGGVKSVGGGGWLTEKIQILIIQRSFGTQKIGGGYLKFRLNASEGFNKIFGVGILENLLAAKSEEIALSSWHLIW